jgi:hypothetical protein
LEWYHHINKFLQLIINDQYCAEIRHHHCEISSEYEWTNSLARMFELANQFPFLLYDAAYVRSFKPFDLFVFLLHSK